MPLDNGFPILRRRNRIEEETMKPVFMVTGMLVAAVLLFVATVVAANRALSDDDAAAATATTTMDHASMNMAGGQTVKGMSFAGAAPDNAAELAKAHKPYPAALPPLTPGDVVKVHMVLKDVTIDIAPGIKYAAWGFEGGAPGPVVHARQGQTVEMTLTNDGAIPHSIDFHAARIAPNEAFVDVMPGKSFTFRFKASDPGVFMYHCGTKPVLMHIANGMYGAIVVDPATPLPKADKSYVLVASEWYLSTDGLGAPAQFDLNKARAMMPDWTTFNGYAGQYVTHPLTADPGDTVRFYVVDAGPSLTTAFHVVGTILDTAYLDGDMHADHALHGVQTVDVPAGGGGVFDVKIDQEGLYPFVSHSFASVDMGQVGLLKVGNPPGTMSH